MKPQAGKQGPHVQTRKHVTSLGYLLIYMFLVEGLLVLVFLGGSWEVRGWDGIQGEGGKREEGGGGGRWNRKEDNRIEKMDGNNYKIKKNMEDSEMGYEGKVEWGRRNEKKKMEDGVEETE